MKLDYVPLLQVQRKLHDIPRGQAPSFNGLKRFRHYLRTILNEDGAGLELPPLVIINPMAKDNVTALLDALLALDADGIAARAVAELSTQRANEPGDSRVTLVVVDDWMAGWTNRYPVEFTLRFQCGPLTGPLPRWSKHFWITAVLWSSEAPSGTGRAGGGAHGRSPGGAYPAARTRTHAPRHAHAGRARHGDGGLYRARSR